MHTPPARINLAASADNLHRAVAFAGSCAAAAGVPPGKRTGICLAVEEAFINICHHAYKGGCGQVELAAYTGQASFPHSLVLEIADCGPEFDLFAIPAPDTSLSIEEREIGGLGVHFIRHFSDQADWRRENGKNILRLIFDLDPGGSHPKDI